MKLALALASTLLLAGCASDPYYAGYGGYSYDAYRPYGHGSTYTYDYAYPYYGYPSFGSGIYLQYRDHEGRYGHRHHDRRDGRDRIGDDPRDRGGYGGGHPYVPPGQRHGAEGR